jgi:hypothetical protein
MNPETERERPDEGGAPTDCAAVLEALREEWAGSALPEAAALGLPAGAAPTEIQRGFALHLESCPFCRSEAGEILRIDGLLRRGFRDLEARIPGPAEARIQETLDSLGRESVEVRLLFRMRRGLRLVLWAAFYGFTLLALAYLAAALYRISAAE